MPTRAETLANLNKSNYSKSEVTHLLNHITRLEKEDDKPRYIKKYDYFVTKDSNGKPRPYVVIKVLQDTVIAIPTSTTEDSLNLMESRSRFLGDGYFGKQLVTVKKDVVMERFAGVYDNPKLVRKAIKAIKEYLNSNL